MIFERIRHELERVRRYKTELSLIFCDLDDFKEINDTMSIGVVFCDGTQTDVDALINRIDTALYVSKRSGKNQVYSLA